GYHTLAAGRNSHAEGYYSESRKSNSHAGGSGTIADALYQTVIGEANVLSTAFSDKFIVGKGDFVTPGSTGTTTRANCFRVTHTGVYAAGSYNASGADYAELFEWADGNPEASDRAGRFVTLTGGKIRLARPGDGYILGLVSGNPSVVGDVYDDQW
ncbi:peptidase G2 autoproteolytic cleavage domain-containing protein, partial [Oscillospiraceae bacterium 38-13]